MSFQMNSDEMSSKSISWGQCISKEIASLLKPMGAISLIIVSLIIAVITSASFDYLTTGTCAISILFLLKAFALTALFVILFVAAMLLLRKLNTLHGLAKLKQIAIKPSAIWLMAIFLTVCWLPYLLLMFPGNLSNDTTGQLAMFYSLMDDGTYALSDHHPFFDTVIFGSVIYFVSHITGSIHIGIFICILLQLCITAVAFAYAFKTAFTRWDISLPLCLVLLLFVALFPLIPIAVASLSKDTFFSWVFLFWFVMLVDLLLTKFERLDNKVYLALFIVVSLLAVLTKKLGLFVVAPSLFLVILVASTTKKNKLVLCIPLVCVVLVMGLIMPRALGAFGIDSGLAKERYSLLYQQTALAYIDHGSEMSTEEISSINAIFGSSEKLGSSYNPAIADPVKDLVDNNLLSDYLVLYVQQGLTYPDSYIEALIRHVSYLFSNKPIAGLFDSSWHTWNNNYLPEYVFEKSDFNSEMSGSISFMYDEISNVPVLGILFSQGLYAVFVPALLIVAALVCRKEFRRNALCIAAPLAISFVGLVLSPTLSSNPETMRYLLPFVYCMPISLFAAAAILSGEPSSQKSR